MPAPTTTPELIALVRKSNLLEPARLDAYLTTNPGPYDSPAELCQKMRADGLITPFHAEQLMRGKYRGFFLGKYKVLDRIGLGGMGQVFLAEHTGMKRRVALKVLPPERARNEYSRERFLREARAAGQLDHPNLVRAFDVDAEGEVIFLVMEFVDGVSFHDLVGRTGPLDPHRVAYYVWQAANGLGYMSERGLIHRDIKPANLLVDRLGVVKILDLGLVRSQVDDDFLTRGEGVKILGTADYLAPEQAIDCSAVDVRADIYGLGATAYFLLTGKPPFEGEKVAQKLIAHQVKLVRPPHEVRPDVPPELSAVICRMMAKKPADRYQTPAEVVAALDAWAQTPPPPPTEQEIPVAVGGVSASPASVSLSHNAVRVTRSGGSFPGLVPPSPSSGSGIRFHSDPKLTARPAPPPEKAKTPLPMRLTPAPAASPLSARSAPALAVSPAPAPPPPLPELKATKFCGTQTHPPLLPAAATHNLPAPGERPSRVAIPKPIALQAAEPPEGKPSRLRKRLSAVAIALVAGVVAWAVAFLTGAAARPSTPAKAPTHEAEQSAKPDGDAAKPDPGNLTRAASAFPDRPRR